MRQLTQDVQDTMTREGAHKQAARIQAYWHGRGYDLARVWVERITFVHQGAERYGYAVRSNLVNGLPPRRSVPDADVTAWLAPLMPSGTTAMALA